ncbi:hypothetical protein EDC01DRAFT_666860 [Geopyxis carbonaria]|nr:hypothetical protein EDC01DRAFT_666860 [Geopyxis carbonaria]
MHATRILRAAAGGTSGAAGVKQGAKRDPELYILGAVMSVAFGGAGFYFGRKPTSAVSEDKSISVKAMPWDSKGSSEGKYTYHPEGNPANAAKAAPSALHSVTVPNVNLPKELHEKFNKYGKEDF